jgi:hypothetical protein
VGGNVDFFMNAVNWLLERDSLLGIAPKVQGELRLDMDRRQLRIMFALMVLALPATFAAVGVLVWFRRRA